jgi:hypothetical protein
VGFQRAGDELEIVALRGLLDGVLDQAVRLEPGSGAPG